MNLKKAGLSEISTILPCGVQDASALESYGLSRCTVDTIVTINVLCCIPAEKSTYKSLYALLKPGG